jgi:hypothetical protein
MRSRCFTFILCWGLLNAALLTKANAGTGSKNAQGAVPDLNETAARAAGFSAAEVKEAGKLYTGKCMRCHKPYEAKAYPQAEWDAWMVKMRKKARLGPEQQALLTRYLNAYRASAAEVRTHKAGQ